MKRFWIVQAIIIVTGLLFVLTTRDADHNVRIMGFRTICGIEEGSTDDPCWIALGGAGAIVFGIGVGLVSYGWIGIGLLFGVGQAATGLIAFGQAAFGPVFVCGQLGVGLSGLGQLAIGGRVVGQGALGWNGKEYLKDLNTRLDQVLRLR